jgi:hypothetical protein
MIIKVDWGVQELRARFRMLVMTLRRREIIRSFVRRIIAGEIPFLLLLLFIVANMWIALGNVVPVTTIDDQKLHDPPSSRNKSNAQDMFSTHETI